MSFIDIKNEDNIASKIEANILLMNALDKLTAKQRALIELYYFYDFTQEELSQVFGNVPNTVGRQINVALAILKKTLEQEEECLSV